MGKLGQVANGTVAVTSHWSDCSRHVRLGVKPYRPESRLPRGRKDFAFHTKPQLAWQLIEEARAAGIPFRLVVADSVYGENAEVEANLSAAEMPYVMSVRPSHGVWQVVEGPTAHSPAFTPVAAAQHLSYEAWQRTTGLHSHGKELVKYVVDARIGMNRMRLAGLLWPNDGSACRRRYVRYAAAENCRLSDDLPAVKRD